MHAFNYHRPSNVNDAAAQVAAGQGEAGARVLGVAHPWQPQRLGPGTVRDEERHGRPPNCNRSQGGALARYRDLTGRKQALDKRVNEGHCNRSQGPRGSLPIVEDR